MNCSSGLRHISGGDAGRRCVGESARVGVVDLVGEAVGVVGADAVKVWVVPAGQVVADAPSGPVDAQAPVFGAAGPVLGG
jgi:hypothetical protein